MEQRNEYGVYVIFSERPMLNHMMQDYIVQCTNTENPETDILMLRKCLEKDVDDTKRWHVCMRKDLLQKLRENGEEHGLKVYVYKPNQKPIGRNKTYAYYIPYDTEEKKESVKQLFKSLEGKYIRPDSYSFHEPLPRENGEERGYILVSFKKNGDYFPRPFIRTLRALINDSSVCGDRLDVKWCSHRVLTDVMEGATK